MAKHTVCLLAMSMLLGACSAFPEQASVALALDNPQQPFQTGLEIAKPTYTPFPTATPSPTPIPPTPTPLPPATDTPAPATFAEDAFVIIENLPAPSGYDSTTPYDAPPAYTGTKHILVDISEQHMYVYEGDVLVYSFVISTGMGNSTRIGSFSVLSKIPNAYGATWNIYAQLAGHLLVWRPAKWHPCPPNPARRRDAMGRLPGDAHFLRLCRLGNVRCAGAL